VSDDDWPPPEARARAALWEGERRLLRAEYAAAGAALDDGVEHGRGSTATVARAMRRLAAAGYRQGSGDGERARRQLERAREELQPFLPVYEEVDLASLLRVVAAALET
jgi:hypothetical protein